MEEVISIYKYLPPHNILAEKMLVSTVLTQESRFFLQTAERLSPDSFYFMSTALLYRSALENINQVGKTKLGHFLINLETKQLISQLGGLEEIIRLVEGAPIADTIEESSLVISDNYIKRLLLVSGDLLCLVSCSKQQITQEHIASIINQLTQACEILEDKETQTLAKILANLLVNLDKTDKISLDNSIYSGFLELDSLTQGFQKSDLVILAGRPSMGKTAFVINVIRHVINKEKSHVILFSLEMSTEQLLRRILAQECRINSRKIQSGKLTKYEWQYIIRQSKALANLNLYIDDSAKISTDTIRSKVRFFQLQRKNIELIIIDYLQLLADTRQADNRSQELSLITRSLKILARELNLPIIVLSQLNRNLEIRTNKRPLLSDLRESGCISKLSRIYHALDKMALFLFDLYYEKVQIINCSMLSMNLFRIDNADISRTGKKPIYKIITDSGRYLELTSNHSILTLNGWKRCDEINNNDMLAIQIYISIDEVSRNILKKFSHLSLTFEGLKEVSIISLQVVFDFTCNYVHNFIVNNFIVHNSIEQDADLVIMIYREGYYNKVAEDQNMTEIIIAKHRNGPTGTFQLKFNAELASFSNI